MSPVNVGSAVLISSVFCFPPPPHPLSWPSLAPTFFLFQNPVACHYAVIYKVHTSVAEDICICSSIKPVVLFFPLLLFPLFSRSSMSIRPRVSSFSEQKQLSQSHRITSRNGGGVTKKSIDLYKSLYKINTKI